jgi:hypothetical protein
VPLRFTRDIKIIEIEHRKAQEVPPPESGQISYTTGRETLLAVPSREAIAASGGLMEGNLERFHADQGNPSRRWEDLSYFSFWTKWKNSQLKLLKNKK